MINRHGLDRKIPRSKKREVRQQCGIGCVLCGAAVCEYDHFDPEFADAVEHRVAGIALLCGTHHALRTRRHLSANTVGEARRNPITFAKSEARSAFDLRWPIDLMVGSSCYRSIGCVVRTLEGEEWFRLEPPEAPGAPLRLSFQFFDERGNQTLRIDRNEWIVRPDLWDVEVEGTSIVVRDRPRNIVLELRPIGRDRLELRRLNMAKNGVSIRVEPGGATTIVRDGQAPTFVAGISVDQADAVFVV